MKQITPIVVLLIAVSVGLFAQTASSPEALLRAAMQRELVDGDDVGAERQYRALIDRFPDNQMVLGQAWLQLAGIFARRHQFEAQRDALDRVVRDYPGAVLSVVAAKRQLSALPQGRGANAIVPDSTSRFPELHPSPYEFTARFQGSRSPDGRWMAKWNQASLVLTDWKTSQERVLLQLNPSERHRAQVAWSPDGQRLAFVAFDANFSSPSIRVVDVSGGQTTRWSLGNGDTGSHDWVSWSPSGQWLVAFLGNLSPGTANELPANTYLVNVRTGESRVVGQTISPNNYQRIVWSPAGDSFAYRAFLAEGGASQLKIVNASTGREQVLFSTESPGAVIVIDWTTSNHVYFATGLPAARTYYLVSPDGGDVRQVCESARGGNEGEECLFVTPDGRSQVVQKNDTKRIVIREIATRIEKPITRGAGEQTMPVLSPDGRVLTFVSNRDGAWGLYAITLDRAPVDQPVKIATFKSPPRSYEHSELSSAQNMVGYWNDGLLLMRLEFPDTQLYRFPVELQPHDVTGSGERLTVGGTDMPSPVVSPDGKRIAYWFADSPTQTGIAVINNDGTRQRTVIDAAHYFSNRRLSWRSPIEVLFYDQSPPKGLNPSLAAVNVDTREVTRFARPDVSGNDWSFDRSRDEVLHSQCTSGARSKDCTVRAFSLSSGAERTVATIPDLLRWSTADDGTCLAYEASSVGKPSRFGLVALDGAALKLAMRFSLDLGAIGPGCQDALVSGSGPTIQLIELATGRIRQFVGPKATPPTVQWRIGPGAWAPDRSFVIVQGAGTRQEWRAWSDVTYDTISRLLGGR